MTVLPTFPKVHFGFGAISELAGELKTLGIAHPLFITDGGIVAAGVFDQVAAALPADVAFTLFDGIPENPTIAGIEAAHESYRANGCDGIVALGGGSVLDSGKLLRVLARQPETALFYLEDNGRIGPDVAPYITIPTTAGTGAEITYGGGIHPAPNTHALGIRSMYVRGDVAICDPELTMSLPPRLTAGTGMDALGHCLEGVLSTQFNPPIEAIALDGIARVGRYIERAVADPSDRAARENMLMAALQGGMAIYKGLGPIHALAQAFGDSPLHHGTLVTVAAPEVVRFYRGHADEKIAAIHTAMGLSPELDLADGIAELNARLGLPSSIRAMGYATNDLEPVIAEAHSSHFNLWAPRKPDRDDYRRLVLAVLG